MKILVTGATGFLGSSLVKILVKNGHYVVVLKRSSSKTDKIDDVLHCISSYDLDHNELEAVFRAEDGISTIIHSATCYGRKGESPAEVFEANTRFPLKLLEVAVRCGVDTFINTDSSLPRYLNPYALSKSQFAEWGRYFADSGAIGFVNVKLEHFYGPWDDESKFVTHVVRNCLRNVPELKLTAGEQLRDFIHIDDVVAAYQTLLSQNEGNASSYQEYALGSGKAISIRDLVETIHKLTDSTTRLNFGVIPYRPNEVMYTQADIGKLQELGWSPKFGLVDGLRDTIEKERSLS